MYPERIVCLTEETVEVLYALGQQHRIVGISGFALRPSQARKEKPKVSTYLDAKYDDIVNLCPDLVLCWSDLQSNIAAELIRLGIPVLCFNHRTIQGILDMIVQLGGMLGVADKSLEYRCGLEQQLVTVNVRASHRQRKPRVYFEEWYNPLISGIGWVSEAIELCGGIDIYTHHRHFHDAQRRIIRDPTEPVVLQPDIMIASWCGKMFKPSHVAARDGWQNFKPLSTGYMVEIHSAIILQPGPALITDGLLALMSIFDAWEHNLPAPSYTKPLFA
jgi:iron complex transport system substrate-binding protein